MNRLNKRIYLVGLLLAIILPIQLQSQVTVGSGIEPIGGALLDLKEKESSETSLVNATKGMMLPRVALESATSLSPIYANATAEDARLSTGMTVYNVGANLRKGILIWDGESWISENGTSELAVIDVAGFSCSTVQLHGAAVVGQAFNSSENYITLTVDVLQKGYYEIVVVSPHNEGGTQYGDNGFSFVLSGEFSATGQYELTIPGRGIPKFATSASGDDLIFKINGTEFASGCSKIVVRTLTDSPLYTLDCSSIRVNGVYKKGQALDATNTVSLIVNSSNNLSNPVNYEISATTADGSFSFSGTGVLSAGDQRITLTGTGTPVSEGEIIFTIQTNSAISGNYSCTFRVSIVREIIISAHGTERYSPFTNMNSYSTPAKILLSAQNFGLGDNSTVRCKPRVIGASGSDAAVIAALATEPDIILLTFGTTMSTALVDALKVYFDKGGVVVLFIETNVATPIILNTLLETSAFSVAADAASVESGAFLLESINHPIVNGPFGDIRGKYMGTDTGYNDPILVSGAITGLTKFASAYNYAYTTQMTNAANYTMAMSYEQEIDAGNNDKVGRSLFIIPDGGAAAGWYFSEVMSNKCFTEMSGIYGYDASSYTSDTNCDNIGSSNLIYPASMAMDGTPIETKSYGRSPRLPVQNGILYANVMAWAIERATKYGIHRND